jgi:hypothetical protein
VVGATVDQKTEINQIHTEATRIHRTNHNVDQAFKQMIIDTFEDPFLNTPSDEIVGCANCTSLQFVSHRLTYYDMIAPA